MQPLPSLFVTQVTLEQTQALRQGLMQKGFVFTQPPHTQFCAKNSHVSCTVYTSGKLVVQGSGTPEFVSFYLEPEILLSFTYGHSKPVQNLNPRIGVDESGKGDFFGPLCVAGVYADESGIEQLAKLGVRDSKTLTDGHMQKLSRQIKEICPYHILHINPRRYNELYEKFRNLNTFLGWGHATVIEQLVQKTGCRHALIDQFASEHVVLKALAKKGLALDLTQRTRGEEDIVVAAASILARIKFVEELAHLGQAFDIELPKGSSFKTVQIGKQLVARHGQEALQETAKLHFKTTQQILR